MLIFDLQLSWAASGEAFYVVVLQEAMLGVLYEALGAELVVLACEVVFAVDAYLSMAAEDALSGVVGDGEGDLSMDLFYLFYGGFILEYCGGVKIFYDVAVIHNFSLSCLKGKILFIKCRRYT